LTSKPPNKLRRFAVPLVALIAAAMASVFLMRLADERTASPRVQSQGEADIGGPYSLTAHTGERVSRSDFEGAYRLIFFGFTHCPDVCPTELAKMSRALTLLEDRGIALERVQPLFITVDPARDTVERLASYMDSFHAKLLGLTGRPADIKATADQFAVHFQKVPGADGESDYLMDHTAMIYLMGPDGGFEDVFTSRETARDIADALTARLG